MRTLLLTLLAFPCLAVDLAERPIVAVFPIGGDAKDTARERAAFALRSKLDRTENFTILDGFRMKDLAAEAKEEIGFNTSAEVVKELAATEKPVVILWGDLVGTKLRVKILDAREPNATPREVIKDVKEPTDMRFATEEILEQVKGVSPFAHPEDEAVKLDARSIELWKTNPNLVANGDFSDSGCWNGILAKEYYRPPLSGSLPEADKVVIYRDPNGSDGKANNALAMRLSRGIAETYGLACLSDPIKIEPNTRYRLSFKYKSDGPTLHVFVKGYTKGKALDGSEKMEENYRRQVPPSGGTNGKWVEVVCDLNPQHPAFAVQTLRIDLYAYLSPGVVEFDDVVLKAVGEQTRVAKDKAIKPPATRPRGAK